MSIITDTTLTINENAVYRITKRCVIADIEWVVLSCHCYLLISLINIHYIDCRLLYGSISRLKVDLRAGELGGPLSPVLSVLWLSGRSSQ